MVYCLNIELDGDFLGTNWNLMKYLFGFFFCSFFLRFWLWAHVVHQLCFGWQHILVHSWCGWVHVLGICKYVVKLQGFFYHNVVVVNHVQGEYGILKVYMFNQQLQCKAIN